MKSYTSLSVVLAATLGLTATTAPVEIAYGQEADELEEVVVTGSRIRRDPLNEATAIMELGYDDIKNSGQTNLGETLQNLPITGSAPNSSFNVPGNSGFPQDGAGIGAGAVQLSLRNVGAKRTLVLVDGKRWIAGASASGVPSTVDLNTIPDNVIDRVEILQDGASAIYGSDAIGGVVNIITNRDFEGFRLDAQTGEYLSDNDGESTSIGLLWGGANDTTHMILSASYADEDGVETASRDQSRFPNPNATSCDVAGSRCSSFTPQGRYIFGPNYAGGASVTLNDGVLNDGGANIPQFDPANPNSLDYHTFTGADRFNYNGPGFNFLRTPNKRKTKAAPEPLCLGNGCGNRINDNFLIHVDNPYNPFGVDLSVADGTLEFFGRRPLESGGRQFFQDVDTYFVSVGLEGEFESSGGRNFYWDLTGSYGENQGFQEKKNSHNAAKLQIAMGDPAVCAATPNCVPFNFFGGQGPDGNGSITQDMLDFVTYTQRDFSEQTLVNYSFNIAGDLFEMPAGTAGFAAGAEYRDQEGSFRPDPVAERGETAGIPSGATAGDFDVSEYYAEVNLPLLSADTMYWEVSLAARYSDYSTSGSEDTYKASTLFQPLESLSLRASISTGFRAPGIGELFGGAAREDFTFLDPCADVLAQVGSANGGRDTPQPQNIIDNCANPAVGGSNSAAGFAGVPVGYFQNNPSLSAVSAGNADLTAETSDSYTVGAVWSTEVDANWIEAFTISLDYFNLEIDDAVSSRDSSDVITACAETLDPLFCDLTPRAVSGAPDVIDNQLQNIGGIETSGYDLMINYVGPEASWGQLEATFNATFLDEYIERTANIGGGESSLDRAGTITSETFERAFPELRWTTNLGWTRDRWAAAMSFRWTDEMTDADGEELDSVLFTDLRVTYTPAILDDGLTVSVGFNNVFDEDPPILSTSTINQSISMHDLQGTVGYLRVSWEL
jgi:iron complex outermembrane receptor protein